MEKEMINMILPIHPTNYNNLNSFLNKDIARNYFILLGLASKKSVYNKIYGEYKEGELIALLFQRNSGTLQFFAPGEFDVEGFINLISTLEYNSLIGSKSYCDKFLNKGIFTKVDDGAYISKLDKDYEMNTFIHQYAIRNIEIDDLDEIVELYRGIFKSFAPKEVMEEKLKSGRGRGVCIVEDGRIISVVQTDFEKEDAAIIVGVGTKEEYQHKGMATECLEYLCRILLKEGKNLFLQYDNLEAGHIYERMGFRRIDQMLHYKK